MNQFPKPKSQHNLNPLAQAANLLRAQRFEDCIALCRQLLRAPSAPAECLHLLALAQQRSGQPGAAEKSFTQLLARESRNPEYLLSYGRFLREQGRFGQAERRLRKACKLAPGEPRMLHALGLLLFHTERPQEAARWAQRISEIAPDFAPGWELLAAAGQKSGDLESAVLACRQGLARSPNDARLHYSLAQLLRQRCDFEAAAEAYARARTCGMEQPELYRNHVDALVDAGQVEGALEVARRGVQRFPQHPLLQRIAARLHAEAGALGDPLEDLRAALRQAPENPALWQTLVELQRRLGRDEEASAVLDEVRARGIPQTPGLGILLAEASARRGEAEAASREFEALLGRFPGDPGPPIHFAMHLLRHEQPDRAAALCDAVLEREPFNQLALAYLSTALQLCGEPRAQWLCDYERMVLPVQVPAPADFAGTDAFFTALRDVLEEQHHTRAHPLEQSVRGGTQTNGFLFRLPHPLLQVLERQIREAVASVLPRFVDDHTHPFWSRRREVRDAEALRFAGAWSVRLRGQGFHTNHIHPEGWISSALYIALPDEVREGSGTDGHIQFGEPLTELGLSLPPQRTVRPEVGTLVLFPSYMWHGTVPFDSEQPRITVAFDLLPSH